MNKIVRNIFAQVSGPSAFNPLAFTLCQISAAGKRSQRWRAAKSLNVRYFVFGPEDFGAPSIAQFAQAPCFVARFLTPSNLAQAVGMTVKAYASRIKCSTRPFPAVTRGDLLSDGTSKQFCQGFLNPAEIDWLTKAARLPGKSLHLAVLLVYLANAANTRQVELSNTASQQFGLDRNAKYRGLCWLEEAGLVRVERKIGRSPAVTILDQRDSA